MKLFLCLLSLLSVANAFYFHVIGGERKCFYKELSQGTLLLGKYNVEVFDTQTNRFIAADSSQLGLVLDIEVSD